jgi:predicted RNA methylase
MPSARFGAAESIARALQTGASPRLLVRTLAGLETLAAAELAEAGHRVIDMSTRQLIVRATSPSIITSPPRLVDDNFIVGGDVADPGTTRADLVALASALRPHLTIPLRHGPEEAMSVSASFVGRRAYSRFDVEDSAGEVIAESTGARYWSRRDNVVPPADRVDWRVVLDGTRAAVAVRPFDAPLHRREWRSRTVAGSLHPPAAAAVARLARIEAGHRVVDPFCGAGTILLEAHHLEPHAEYLGIDRDPGAVRAARINAERAGDITWRAGDAGSIRSWPGYVDRVITNPPWNVRVPLGDFSVQADAWRQALRPGGLAVAIVNSDQAEVLLRSERWHVREVVVATPNTGPGAGESGLASAKQVVARRSGDRPGPYRFGATARHGEDVR